MVLSPQRYDDVIRLPPIADIAATRAPTHPTDFRSLRQQQSQKCAHNDEQHCCGDDINVPSHSVVKLQAAVIFVMIERGGFG